MQWQIILVRSDNKTVNRNRRKKGSCAVNPLRGADLKETWGPDELSKNTEQFSLYSCDVRGRVFFIVNKLFSRLDVYFYRFTWPRFFFTF